MTTIKRIESKFWQKKSMSNCLYIYIAKLSHHSFEGERFVSFLFSIAFFLLSRCHHHYHHIYIYTSIMINLFFTRTSVVLHLSYKYIVHRSIMCLAWTIRFFLFILRRRRKKINSVGIIDSIFLCRQNNQMKMTSYYNSSFSMKWSN